MNNAIKGLRYWLMCAAGAFAAYFALATWLDLSFVNPAPTGRLVVKLLPPFTSVGGHAFIGAPIPGDAKTLSRLGDDPAVSDSHRSPVVVFEDKRPLGPAHSNFREISQNGLGHYAHWRDQGIMFSTSDNSDPNENRRSYWAVVRSD